MTTTQFTACWMLLASACQPQPSTAVGWRASHVVRVRDCVAPCCVYNFEAQLAIRYPLRCAADDDGGVR